MCIKRGSLQFCQQFYRTLKMKTKISDQGSDFGYADLQILGKNAAFCLATDQLGLHLGGQVPRRAWPSSLRPTDHHAQGLHHLAWEAKGQRLSTKVTSFKKYV